MEPGEGDAMKRLFSRDVCQELLISGAGRSVVSPPWGQGDRTTTGRPSSPAAVGKLTLSVTSITNASWMAMWEGIGTNRVTNLESVTISLGLQEGVCQYRKKVGRVYYRPYGFVADLWEDLWETLWMSTALNSCASLVDLKDVVIGPLYTYDHEGRQADDLSEALVALLERSPLQLLKIQGGREETIGTFNRKNPTLYQLDVGLLCGALGNNKCLEILNLDGLDLRCDNDQAGVGEQFLDLLSKGKNATIQSMVIVDVQGRFSYGTNHSCRWGGEDRGSFRQASLIDFWLKCNRMGRGKSNRVEHLVDFLVLASKTASSALRDELDENIDTKIQTLALNSSVPDLDEMTRLYIILCELPVSWFQAEQREIDRCTMCYSLLRASPALWCLSTSSGINDDWERKFGSLQVDRDTE